MVYFFNVYESYIHNTKQFTIQNISSFIHILYLNSTIMVLYKIVSYQSFMTCQVDEDLCKDIFLYLDLKNNRLSSKQTKLNDDKQSPKLISR